jgi:DNA-binding transcriptional regulator GbsR (MarR family)
MDHEEAAFVEAMGQFLGSSGMTPMAGRMWGWLLICEPPEQTAAQLAEALQASRGAISGTARLLTTAGMIRRTRRRGERREYFSVPPGTFISLIASSGQAYRRVRELSEQGLALTAARSEASRSRVQEVHDAFRFLERELPALVERFIQEQGRQPAGEVAT